MPGRRVDDRNLVVDDPVEGLREQAVRGCLQQVDALEVHVAVGVLEPVGRARLRVGVDQRDGTPARGGQRREVHGGRRLPDPTLECRDNHDHPATVASLPASPQGSAGVVT